MELIKYLSQSIECPHVFTLKLANIHFQISSNDCGWLNRARLVLESYIGRDLFSIDKSGSPNFFHVRVHCLDGSVIDNIATNLMSEGRISSCNTYRNEWLNTVEFLWDGQWTTAYIPSIKDRIFVRQKEEILLLVGRDDSARDSLRIVREIATRRVESSGGISLHAAAVAMGTSGILIVGPSGAGKTSLAIHLLRARSNCQFICNDRALILVNEGFPKIYLSPLPVRISQGTVAAFKELGEYVENDVYERPQPFGSNGAAWLRDSYSEIRNIKLEMTPDELVSQYKTSIFQECNLTLILRPYFISCANIISTSQMTKYELFEVIRSELRTPRDDMWPTPWLEQRTNAAWDDTVQKLVNKVRAFKLYFGNKVSSEAVYECVQTVIEKKAS